MRNPETAPPVDVVVIGGGPAGLQAALTIGRVHRRAVLFDSGEYRNGTVAHAHNLIGHDGAAPAQLRATARAELARYATVEVVDAAASSVRPAADGFVVESAAGSVATRAVILATGMHDELPDVPGLAAEWGARAAQCPFCHAHEFAGRPIALLGEGEHLAFVHELLRPVASEVVVIAPHPLLRVDSEAEGLRLSVASDAAHAPDEVAVAGIFVTPTPSQRSDLPAQLGLAMLPSGCVGVEPFGQTSIAGIYAAGDMAHPASMPGPMVSLAAAIASGQAAAAGALRDAISRDLASS